MEEDSDGGMCNPFLYIKYTVTLISGQYLGWEFCDILNNGQLFEITGDT